MTGEQYRAYLSESIKIGARMMYDMAEDIEQVDRLLDIWQKAKEVK